MFVVSSGKQRKGNNEIAALRKQRANNVCELFQTTNYIQRLFRGVLPPSLALDRYAGMRSLSRAVVMQLHDGCWLHSGTHPAKRHQQTLHTQNEKWERTTNTCGRTRRTDHSAEQEGPKAGPTVLALTIRPQCVATQGAPQEITRGRETNSNKNAVLFLTR